MRDIDAGKISIIMGIYNCADTLSEAIDSILAQTYTNWQLIMCDDCSTDNTYAVAKEYVKRYPDKMILIRNEKNSRLAYSLNHCLEYATGKYIARMDGDDKSVPDRFEKQIAYLNEHPDIQLVGTAMQVFNETSDNIRIMTNNPHPDKYSTRYGGTFFHATLLTYKCVYDKLGGYTVAKRTNRGQDYDLWFRFYAEGFNGHNMQEPLYLVREDMNAVKRRTFKMRWEVFQTTKYGFKLLGFPKSWLVKEFISVLVKSITPYKLQYMYHMNIVNKE